MWIVEATKNVFIHYFLCSTEWGMCHNFLNKTLPPHPLLVANPIHLKKCTVQYGVTDYTVIVKLQYNVALIKWKSPTNSGTVSVHTHTYNAMEFSIGYVRVVMEQFDFDQFQSISISQRTSNWLLRSVLIDFDQLLTRNR